MPACHAKPLKADDEDRRSDDAPLVQVKENEEVVETNLRQGGAEEKEEVATETESATRESVVLVPDPIVSTPWSLLFGRGEPCVTAVKTRHTLWCRASRVP